MMISPLLRLCFCLLLVTGSLCAQRPAKPIRFDALQKDLGTIFDGQKRTATFAFENTSKAKIRFFDVKSTCGCTVPELPKKVFEPGEKCEMKVIYDPRGRAGKETRKITIATDSLMQTKIELAVKVDVVPQLQVKPRFLSFSQIERGEASKPFNVFVESLRKDVQIQKIGADNPLFVIRENGSEDIDLSGRPGIRHKYEVIFLGSNEVGQVNTTLEVKTDLESPFDVARIRGRAEVVGALRWSTPLARLRVTDLNKDFKLPVSLSSRRGRKFDITGLEVVEGPTDIALDVVPDPARADTDTTRNLVIRTRLVQPRLTTAPRSIPFKIVARTTEAEQSEITLAGSLSLVLKPNQYVKPKPLALTGPLRFEKATEELGKILDMKTRSTWFTFRNASGRTMKITNIKASCGCTYAGLLGEGAPADVAAGETAKKRMRTTTLEPGEERHLEVAYDPRGRQGKDRKSVTISTDNPDAKQVKLEITTEVIPEVGIYPRRFVNFGTLDPGQESKEFDFEVRARKPEFKIEDIVTSDPRIIIEPVAVEQTLIEGEAAVIWKYKARFEGGQELERVSGRVRLLTNQDAPARGAQAGLEKQELVMNANWSIAGPVVAFRSSERLSLRQPGKPFTKDVQFRHRKGGRFRILKVEAEGAPKDLKLDFDIAAASQKAAGTQKITVRGVQPVRYRGESNAINFQLIVTTDAEEHPQVRLPFTGSVLLQAKPAAAVKTTPAPAAEASGEQK